MRNLFPATRLGCRSKLNSWKVNVSLGDHVEVVCKNIERDIGDDLGDFTFVKACILYRLHVRVRHFSTIDDQSSRELQSSFGSRASRVTSARRQDRVIIQTDHFRSEEHTSELQSQSNLVCRLLLEKKKENNTTETYT